MPAHLSDRAPSSGENVRSSAVAQPLAINSSQSGKRHRRWLDLPEGGNPRPRKIFSKGSARSLSVVADLPVAMGPLSGAINDAISNERISPRRLLPVCKDTSRDVGSAPIVFSLVSRLKVSPSSAHERPARMLPLVTGRLVVPSRLRVGQPGGQRRSGRSRNFWASPGSAFSSVLEYLPRFRDWLDGQRFAAKPSVSSFRRRSSPPGDNLESPASARFIRCRVLCPRGGDMIPSEHGAVATDMQLCCSSCELGYLGRLVAMLPSIRSWPTALFCRLSLVLFTEC